MDKVLCQAQSTETVTLDVSSHYSYPTVFSSGKTKGDCHASKNY